jgi:hypothetical protein
MFCSDLESPSGSARPGPWRRAGAATLPFPFVGIFAVMIAGVVPLGATVEHVVSRPFDG